MKGMVAAAVGASLLVSGSVEAGQKENPRKTSILLIGDSIGADLGASKVRYGVAGRLAQYSRGDWFVHNLSRGGMTIAPGGYWPAFDPALIGLGGVWAKNVVVMLGVNDYLQSLPLEDVTSRYQAIIDAALSLDMNLVCVTPVPLIGEEAPNGLGLRLEDYRLAIAGVCGQSNRPVIDGKPLMPAKPELFADGSVHPNNQGYGFLVRNLKRSLEPLIRQERAALLRSTSSRAGW